MSKKILITGGTGLVGQRLVSMLQEEGHDVAILSRTAGSKGTVKTYVWDIENEYIDPEAFEQTEVIIHLAGAGVADKRWTAKRKETIYNSRVDSSSLLYNYLKSNDHQVKTFIAASAIGLYGDDTGSSLIQEDAPTGKDFLAQVVDAWENATNKVSSLGIRLFQPRIGIVLSAKGGALQELLKPPVAAPLGSGDQYMSWIHIEDLCRMILFGIENEKISGPYNAVGPNPKTNQEFTKVAAKTMGKLYLPIAVPKLVLKLILGEMAQIVLGGSRISAEKVLASGFSFKFPQLDKALEDLKSA